MVKAGLAGAAMLALAVAGAIPALADGMKGVFAPSGGTSGAFKSGGKIFGKSGAAAPGAVVVVPPGAGKGGKAPGFVYEHETGAAGGEHPGKHRHMFRGHGFPVIVYPYGGSYAVTTEPYDEDDYDDGAETADDGIFTITNSTGEEMTVYDNGKPVCVLAPGVRCSFDISHDRHDISVRVGTRDARREIPDPRHGGKMIVVWEALKKAE